MPAMALVLAHHLNRVSKAHLIGRDDFEVQMGNGAVIEGPRAFARSKVLDIHRVVNDYILGEDDPREC